MVRHWAERDRQHVVLNLRQGHDLSVLLKVVGLSHSTFYYQVKARIGMLYERHKGH